MVTINPRSVTVLLRNTNPADLMETLEELGARRQRADASWAWLYGERSRPQIMIHIIEDLADYEIDLTAATYQDWWLPMKNALGFEPTVAMQVYHGDASAAGEALNAFVRLVLSIHPGVAFDDVTGESV